MIVHTAKGIKWITDDDVEQMYLDYVNNFITLSRFAEYYGISYFSAQRIYNKFH